MNKNSGSELRDSVAGLLTIKFSTVEPEKRLAATTADVFYIDDNSSFPLKIAVECKDWSTPLTSSNLADIHNLYRPSLDSGEIDRLLIVSRHELGIHPTETLNRLGNVAYKQFDTFVHSLMNFSLLLQNNIAAFKNHDSYNNFIHPRVEGSPVKLADAVLQWLAAEDSPVAMVYGGYGLGKTSFSHYLASSLTVSYRQNQFKRIPIRLPLGGLFTKQDLKALVCAELTGAEGQPAVGNFTYDLFVQMVRSGAIFLILDGFDEMRHAMSIEDFAYTFEQMSPLFQGDSKAIILGRPDAFFDNSEETDVINSLLSATQAKDDQIPKFEVDRFTREEVDLYIENFCSTRTLTPAELALVKSLRDKEY